MTQKIKCPACSKWLYFPNFSECSEEYLESICSSCKYKYAFMTATVQSFEWEFEPLDNNKYTQHPLTKGIYRYQVHLIRKDGMAKAVRFSILEKSRKFLALTGDEVSIVYTMREKRLKDLVWIENKTRGQNLLILNPRMQACSQGLILGIMTLVISYMMTSLFNISTNKLFWAIAIPSSVGVSTYVIRRQEFRVRDRQEIARLNYEQQLLLKRFNLEQRTQVLQQEMKNSSSLIYRLDALRQKMLNAPEELYAHRVETVSKGIDTLSQQLDLTENLITGYTQILNMLAIDYETSQLAEQIPEDLTGTILGHLDEMKVIEARKEELSLLVNPQKLLS